MASKISEGFLSDYPLKNLTTFGIGGPARYFIAVHQIEEMQEALNYCNQHQLPFFILGKGSNSLFDDRGFNGLVIANRIDFLNKPAENLWHVGAGYSFSLLGSQTARQGWSGLEFASGIPGSVGGAVFMNAGANGRETGEALETTDFITSEGELISLERSKLQFRYRYSSFQEMSGAIVGAVFRLTPSQTARSDQINLINYRQKTQPYGDKSAGCIFRNPPNTSAGALIDQLGLKGRSIGGAQVSQMHANFLINTGTASSQDVLSLIDLIKSEVSHHTRICLESEVRYVPYKD